MKTKGLSATTIVFIVFLILKLTDTINWSWWWITAPLWIGIALFISAVIIVSLIAIIFR